MHFQRAMEEEREKARKENEYLEALIVGVHTPVDNLRALFVLYILRLRTKLAYKKQGTRMQE